VNHVSTYKAKLAGSIFISVLHAQIEDGIVEGAADEPLNREVVDPLGGAGGVVRRGLVPALDELVANRQSGSLVCGELCISYNLRSRNACSPHRDCRPDAQETW
jgi:hypothetical protein